MGRVAFQWGEEGDNNQLTLLMNRDNWESRVIRAAAWDREDKILSGRCEDNKGTWFGISRNGRVAFLVNTSLKFDVVDKDSGTEKYTIEFLESDMSPKEFAKHVVETKKKKHDQDSDDDDEEERGLVYSLIVADMTLKSMVHIRRPIEEATNIIVENVPYGVHTLSAYGLDATDFDRDSRLGDIFNKMITDYGIDNLPLKVAGLFMYDDEGDEDAVFLQTMKNHPNPYSNYDNYGRERYGTTSTASLTVKCSGEVIFFERYRDNGEWHEHDFTFNIQ